MGVDASLTGVPEFDKLEIIKVVTALESAPTTAGNITLTTYTHSLGFIPIIFAYFGAVGAEGIAQPFLGVSSSGVVNTLVQLNAVNRLDLTFTHFERTNTAGPFNFKIYIMRVKGTAAS